MLSSMRRGRVAKSSRSQHVDMFGTWIGKETAVRGAHDIGAVGGKERTSREGMSKWDIFLR